MGTRERGLPRKYYDLWRRKKKPQAQRHNSWFNTFHLGNPKLQCNAGFQKLPVVVYREGREMRKYSFLPFSKLELRLYYLLSSHPLHHQVETGSSFQEASTNPRSPLPGSLMPSSLQCPAADSAGASLPFAHKELQTGMTALSSVSKQQYQKE